MTTKTGFNDEQFEISAADGNIPRMALQGVTELQEFIEARKRSTESVRHLADALSKKLRLQPPTEAAQTLAISSAPAVPPSEIAIRTQRHPIRDSILNRLLPIGYQDESGFHPGTKNERPINGNGHAAAPGSPSA